MNPPPLPHEKRRRRNRIILLFIAIVWLVIIIGVIAFRSIIASGITANLDNKFGDQHLKTAVALIELHKVRYGKYPDSLRDLKFTGDWDPIHVNVVGYYPSPDSTSYYVEVKRGWLGKPTFTVPDEFWQGTGFSPTLRPKDH